MGLIGKTLAFVPIVSDIFVKQNTIIVWYLPLGLMIAIKIHFNKEQLVEFIFLK